MFGWLLTAIKHSMPSKIPRNTFSSFKVLNRGVVWVNTNRKSNKLFYRSREKKRTPRQDTGYSTASSASKDSPGNGKRGVNNSLEKKQHSKLTLLVERTLEPEPQLRTASAAKREGPGRGTWADQSTARNWTTFTSWTVQLDRAGTSSDQCANRLQAMAGEWLGALYKVSSAD